MNRPSRKIIGINVRRIRKALNLSQLDFSILIGISKPSVINIESGNSGYNLDLLERIISFTNYSLSELSKDELEIGSNFREKLIEKYKKDDKYQILSKTPTIVYAIEFKLLVGGFLNEYRETNEIKKFFVEQFGWQFNGTSITNALTRNQGLIEVKKHSTKANTNLYKKRPL